jgi:ribonuclease J
MIDGKAFKDVSDVVMRDRELLAKDGLILITANINPRTKTVVLGPEIVTRGFVFNKENEDVNDNMKAIFAEVSKGFLASKFINWSEYKIAIKNEISHYIYKEVKRSPIIIPVLISTDIEAISQTEAA